MGCLLWSLAHACTGLSGSVLQLTLTKVVNGIGLGLIGPLIYGMVVDVYDDSHRGRLGCEIQGGGLVF